MTVLPKAIYRFNSINCSPCQITNGIFHRTRKCLSLYENTRKTQVAKAVLRKKNGVRSIKLPDIKLCAKATVTKSTVWYWNKSRNTDQWNRIESLSINGAGNWPATCKSMKLGLAWWSSG